MSTSHPSLDEAVGLLRSLEERAPGRAGEVRLVADREGARIELCNPGAHNAMTARMMRQLGEAVVRIRDAELGIVTVASGHGGTFCAGGHLVQVRQSLLEPEAARLMTLGMAAVLDALWTCPAVVIALVEGAAIGGGLEIVSACDLVFAVPAARLDPAQVRLGVAAGWGGARRIATRVGRARALRLLATGQALTAGQALALGLIDHVGPGPADRLLQEGAGVLLERPIAAVRAIKTQILSSELHRQAAAFLEVWGGPDHRVALGVEP